MKITINKHSSICINGNIYIDPLQLESEGHAKYIFITHSHWDHFSVEDINKLTTVQTIIICPKSMKDEMKAFSNTVVFVEPKKAYEVEGLKFETFLSYNINKDFHKKENNWVGYNIYVEDKRVAVVGDSDSTDELKAIKTDVLLVPIGGTYTMNVKEAAELTNLIAPKKVIPTHYGEIVGDKQMGKEFQKLINKNTVCELLI